MADHFTKSRVSNRSFWRLSNFKDPSLSLTTASLIAFSLLSFLGFRFFIWFIYFALFLYIYISLLYLKWLLFLFKYGGIVFVTFVYWFFAALKMPLHFVIYWKTMALIFKLKIIAGIDFPAAQSQGPKIAMRWSSSPQRFLTFNICWIEVT